MDTKSAMAEKYLKPIELVSKISRFSGFQASGGKNHWRLGFRFFLFLFFIFQATNLYVNFDSPSATQYVLFVVTCINGTSYLFLEKGDVNFQRLTDLSKKAFLKILSVHSYFEMDYDINLLVEKKQKSIWTRFLIWGSLMFGVGLLITFTIFIRGADQINGCYYTLPMPLCVPAIDCSHPTVFFLLFALEAVLIAEEALIFQCFAMMRENFVYNISFQCAFLNEAFKYANSKTLKRRESECCASLANGASSCLEINSGEDNLTTRLKNCIELHQLIEEQMNLMDDLFSTQFIIDFSCCTFSVCLSIYQVVKGGDPQELPMFIWYASAICCHIYHLCNMGTTLHSNTTSIAESAYGVNWYDYKPKERKMIYYIIVRAQRSRHLQGMKSIKVSCMTFEKIIRMSYSLLLFLFNTKEDTHHRDLLTS